MRPPLSRVLYLGVTCLAAMLPLAARPSTALAMLVPINHAERLSLRGAAASVVLGNAAIVSVTIIDTHTVYLMGKGPGVTNLAILDRAGRPIFTTEITVSTPGSGVTLYRGDRRTMVNCTYGCVETPDGAPSPPGGMGAAAIGAAVGSALPAIAGAAHP